MLTDTMGSINEAQVGLLIIRGYGVGSMNEIIDG